MDNEINIQNNYGDITIVTKENVKELSFSDIACNKPSPYVNRTILNKSIFTSWDNPSDTIIKNLSEEIHRKSEHVGKFYIVIYKFSLE